MRLEIYNNNGKVFDRYTVIISSDIILCHGTPEAHKVFACITAQYATGNILNSIIPRYLLGTCPKLYGLKLKNCLNNARLRKF